MTDTLGTALLATQQEINNPPLDDNGNFGSFSSLKAHLATIKPAANKNNLAIVQELAEINGVAALRTRVIHAQTFEFLESVVPLPIEKPGPQAFGAALTYTRRYALASIFGVVGADDDPDKTPSSPRQGGRSGTTAVPAVEAEGIPSPPAPAGTPPTTTTTAAALVGKAQQAAAANKPTVQPGQPQPAGDDKYDITTHVVSVDGPNPNGWFDIHVMINGQQEKLSTKRTALADAAQALVQTTALVTYSEKQKGTFLNRYLEAIEPAPGLEQAFAGITTADDIPFGPVIW